jgi:hypothetical protein
MSLRNQESGISHLGAFRSSGFDGQLSVHIAQIYLVFDFKSDVLGECAHVCRKSRAETVIRETSLAKN